MLQANPTLTPNLVKAHPAVHRAGVPGLQRRSTQGAGFLNTLGAVRLARFFADGDSRATRYPGAERVEPAHHLGQPP